MSAAAEINTRPPRADEAETYRTEAARLRSLAPKLQPEARQAARTYARRLLRWAKRAERKS